MAIGLVVVALSLSAFLEDGSPSLMHWEKQSEVYTRHDDLRAQLQNASEQSQREGQPPSERALAQLAGRWSSHKKKGGSDAPEQKDQDHSQ